MDSRSVPDPVVVCAEVLGRFGVSAADVAGAGESPEDAIETALERAPSRAAFLRRTISTAPRGIDAPARYARETPWVELRTAFEALGWSLAVEDRSGRPVGAVASPAGPFSVTVEDAEGRARTATVEYPATPLGRYNLPAILARVEDGVLYGLDWTFVALSDGADRWRFAPVRREDLETLQEAHGPRVTPFERPVLARRGPGAYDPPAADDVWPAWTDDVDAGTLTADRPPAGDDATQAADDVITFVGDGTGDAESTDDGARADADAADTSADADTTDTSGGGETVVADVTFDGLSGWSTADDGAESDDEDESATEGDSRVESVTAAGGSIGSATTLGSGSAEGTTEAAAGTDPATARPGATGGASASAATSGGSFETDGLTLSGSPTTRTVGDSGDDDVSETTAADPTDGDAAAAADDDGAFFDSGLSGGPSVDRVENESFGLPESQTEDERLQAAGAAIDAGGGVSVEGLLDDESFLPTIPAEGPTEVTLSFEDSFDPSAPSPAETREADSEDGFVWVNADGLE